MGRTIRIPGKLLGAQRDFYQDDVTRFLHMSGGFGSGKTHTLVRKVLKLSWLNRPYPGGLVVPTFTEYKRDVLPAMEEVLDRLRIKYVHHKGQNWFRFPWSRGKLYVATGEKRIRGPNWAYAGINELTMLSLKRYQDVASRVRVKGARNPQIASSGTPEGMASEFYDVFVNEPWKGSKCLYMDTRENAENLDSEYIEMLKAAYDAKTLDAYMRGLWVSLDGSRFYYSYDPVKHRSAKIHNWLLDSPSFHCSIDYNVDPMCANLWLLERDYAGKPKKLYGWDQIELTGGAGYNTHNLADALLSRGYHGDNTVIYPDPAGNARSTKGRPDNEILREHGFHQIKVKPAAPKFRERQLNVNNLFEKGAIQIHPEKQKGLHRDLVAVEQDPVTLEKLKDNPRLTHHSDGLDYMADILFPFSGHRTGVLEKKIR